MSKAVRIRDHLHAEIDRLAKLNRRTLIDQLELLLEQAIRLEGATVTGERRTASGDTDEAAPSPDDKAAEIERANEGRGTPPLPPADDALRPPPEREFKPDFKTGKKK